jgi:tetratricopeptide (TPR) repeat protein/tRNA A-37 threonylcarbamoyl transferase component Bud32
VSAGAGNVADDQPETTGVAIIRGGMIGRYIVLGLLGKGGMGVVYSAYDPELDRKVALKLLRVVNRKKGEDLDAKRSRLLREAKAIARLSHPSVVVVYDVGTYQDQVFIAMELVDGMTALRWRDTRKPSWKEILRVFIDAGEGIAAAHAADLIHRDFKPENVMVTREGKVRVMDFGLARTMERFTTESSVSSVSNTKSADDPTMPGIRPAEPRLTHEGNVVGTPAYMPPEQYLGVTDERSDQFAFCVSLYECLYGQHPFEARTSVGLASNMQAGRVHEAPAGTKVPTWVRKILIKGLKPRPEDRWASMPEMLAALRNDPAVARRRWLIAGSAVVAVGGLLFGMQRAADSRRAFCAAGPERVSAAWELPAKLGGSLGPHHDAVSKAFLATGKSYAHDAVRGVLSLLDDYAVKWVGVYKDACEATNVRGEQSAEVLDLRMECLNDRLGGMRALVDVFAGATGEVVEHGVEAAHALSSLDGCSDIKQLKSLIAPPDPAVKQRVEELRRELGQIKAVHDAGRYVAAMERLTPVVQEARNLQYRPLESEALARMSAAYVDMRRNAEAEPLLRDALRTAVASHHDDLLPEIASNLIWVAAMLGKYEDAERWIAFADGVVERTGGEQTVVYAWILNNIGVAHQLQGHYATALEYWRRATAIKEKVLGPDDPDFAISLGNLALALNALGQSDEALAVSDRSLRIRERAQGKAHPRVADEYSNKGEILTRLKRPQEALAAYSRALDIWTRELGPDDPLVAFALTGQGTSLTSLGKDREAVVALERALLIREHHDSEREHLGETEFALAKALWGEHRNPARAIELARSSLIHYAARPGSETARANITSWLAERRSPVLAARSTRDSE